MPPIAAAPLVGGVVSFVSPKLKPRFLALEPMPTVPVAAGRDRDVERAVAGGERAGAAEHGRVDRVREWQRRVVQRELERGMAVAARERPMRTVWRDVVPAVVEDPDRLDLEICQPVAGEEADVAVRQPWLELRVEAPAPRVPPVPSDDPQALLDGCPAHGHCFLADRDVAQRTMREALPRAPANLL